MSPKLRRQTYIQANRQALKPNVHLNTFVIQLTAIE